MFSFNAYEDVGSGFDEARLSTDRTRLGYVRTACKDVTSSLASLDATLASFRTLCAQNDQQPRTVHREDGMREQRRANAPTRYLFETTIHGYLTETYLPDQFGFIREDNDVDTFEEYRQLLRFCYEREIDTRIATSPCHAWQWEALHASGLWPTFEEWKRLLLQVNLEEANAAGMEPYPVWDCAVFNEYTTEPVPQEGNAEATMKWYWDSSHFKSELGDMILDLILSNNATDSSLGQALAPANLEAHLEKVRADRDRYQQTHPDDVATIQMLAASR